MSCRLFSLAALAIIMTGCASHYGYHEDRYVYDEYGYDYYPQSHTSVSVGYGISSYDYYYSDPFWTPGLGFYYNNYYTYPSYYSPYPSYYPSYGHNRYGHGNRPDHRPTHGEAAREAVRLSRNPPPVRSNRNSITNRSQKPLNAPTTRRYRAKDRNVANEAVRLTNPRPTTGTTRPSPRRYNAPDRSNRPATSTQRSPANRPVERRRPATSSTQRSTYTAPTTTVRPSVRPSGNSNQRSAPRPEARPTTSQTRNERRTYTAPTTTRPSVRPSGNSERQRATPRPTTRPPVRPPKVQVNRGNTRSGTNDRKRRPRN